MCGQAADQLQQEEPLSSLVREQPLALWPSALARPPSAGRAPATLPRELELKVWANQRDWRGLWRSTHSSTLTPNPNPSPNLSPNLSPHLSPHLSPNQPNPNHNPGPLCRLRARTETRGACVRHRGPRATSVHACDSVAILRHRDSDGARRWRAWHGLAPRARPHHRARHRACCGGAATVVLAASVVRGPAWSKVPRTISRPFSPCAATQRSGSPSPAALALEAI